MSFWQWLTGAGATPNATVENPDSVGPTYRPGDPHGVTLDDPTGPVNNRMAAVVTSPWDGWPAQWATPAWGSASSTLEQLTDVAWAALDLNSSVLSAMPVYRTRSGRVLPPTTWMANPDPDIYTDWSEFAKQLFWEFQLGEAFVLQKDRPNSPRKIDAAVAATLALAARNDAIAAGELVGQGLPAIY